MAFKIFKNEKMFVDVFLNFLKEPFCGKLRDVRMVFWKRLKDVFCFRRKHGKQASNNKRSVAVYKKMEKSELELARASMATGVIWKLDLTGLEVYSGSHAGEWWSEDWLELKTIAWVEEEDRLELRWSRSCLKSTVEAIPEPIAGFD